MGDTRGCGRRAGGAGGAGGALARRVTAADGGGSTIVGTSPAGSVRASSPVSSAPTKAPALGHRSSGFFAVHLRIARRNGSDTLSGGGSGKGSCTCFIMIATGVSAAKGTRPASIS